MTNLTLPRLTAVALLAGLAAFPFHPAPAQEAAPAASAPAKPARPAGPRDGRLPKLPVPITSFGAAVLGDSLYIYSGHTGKAHAHSRDNLSDSFIRTDITKGSDWEKLPMREKLQGFALVAWKDSLARVGGLTMRNPAGEPADMHSTASVELFNPATKEWTTLTPLPEPRSSFDSIVIGDKLYVIGGWALSGSDKTGRWSDNDYVADLSRTPIVWEPLPRAPFKHRALAVANAGTQIVAIGGLDKEGESRRDVFILDTVKGEWSKGPDLPGDEGLKGFGVSAFGVGDVVWASGADGKVHSLKPGATEWRDAHYTLASPRFFHRLLHTSAGTLLFVGGAGKGGHMDTIEQVELATLQAKPVTSLPASDSAPVATGKGQTTWPGFRGNGDSHTSARDLPLKWSDAENIAWNATLIGTGQSSPLVWQDKVFVTSVEGEKKQTLAVQCLDLATGKELWAQRFESSQPLPVTDYISKAAPTPAVDAERVYAFFESGDLFALDHTGKLAWKRALAKEYGEPKGNHGLGGSLAQSPGAVIVLVDHSGPSYLLALDKKNGSNLWKTERPERVAWSTPVYTESIGAPEIVVSSAGSVEGYAAADGKQLWTVDGLKGNTVPSPTVAKDWIIAGSGDRDNTVAVKRDNGSASIRWKAAQASASFSSPLVVGQNVYCVNKAGVAFCNDLATGELRWSTRLPDSCWASPVATGDLVYFFSKNGTTTVLRDTPTGPEKVAESKITVSDRVYGVAAVDGAILLRSGDRLTCIRSAGSGVASVSDR